MDEELEINVEAEALIEIGADYSFPSDNKILEQSERRIARMTAHWSPIFRESKDDWNVYTGNQWTNEASSIRGNRPKVTDDFTAPYIEFVIAKTFEDPTTFKISAKEETAKLKTKALAEALRYYENFGEGKESKSWALECASVGGFGYYKAVYDLRDAENGGTPTIGIEQVANPFSILQDENSMKLDGSDARYLVEYLDDTKNHYTYYWHDEKNFAIVLWAEIKDNKIITKDVYPSNSIPVVPIYGRVSHVNGKTNIQGLIRVIKDKQREWNWIKSDAIERIATTPTATTFVAAGSLDKKNKGRLSDSFTKPVNFVEIQPITTGGDENGTGTQLVFPTRANTAPDLGYVQSQLDQITESVKTSTGIYSTAMGQEATGVESGTAIDRKTSNSNRGILRYDSHLKISDAHMGRIELDLIQNIIAPTGFLPIENEKGEQSIILVGKPEINELGEPILPRDEKGNVLPFIEDADVTDSDISITTQPAYATRKEEGVAKVIDLIGKLDPAELSKLVPDIMEDLDFPGSERYANTLRGITGEDGNNSAQLMQQVEQMKVQIEQGSEQLKQMQNENMQLQMELKTQSQAMLQKAQMDNQTKINVENMKIQSSERIAMFKTRMQEKWHTGDVELDYQKEINKANIANAKIEADADKQNKDILVDAVNQVNTNVNSGGFGLY